MNQQKFLESLTSEQQAAFAETRDAIMAANSTSMKEIGELLVVAKQEVSTLTAERDTLANKLIDATALIEKGARAILTQDKTVLQELAAQAVKTDNDRKREVAQAKLDAANRQATEAQAELDALK